MTLSKNFLLIIFISLFYSVLWFSVFIGLAFYIEDYTELLWMFFLFIYLLFAQPLRDTFVFYIIKNIRGRTELKTYKQLNALNKIDSLAKSFSLLKDILKDIKCPSLDIHSISPEAHCTRISIEILKKETKQKTIHNEELFAYLHKYNEGGNITDNYPATLRRYLKRKNINCIVPVVFRGVLLGFFTFPVFLTKERIELFNHISNRFGLIMQNSALGRNIHMQKFLDKDFQVARKVESYLGLKNFIDTSEYRINKLQDGWESKYFPVYCDVKSFHVPGKNDTPLKIIYIILCRPNKNLQKGAILNLCSVQGYFASLCQLSTTISQLGKKMQKVLIEQMEGLIHLEGFLIRMTKDRIMTLPFGKELQISSDEKISEISDSNPLGSSKWLPFNLVRVRFQDELIFTIHGYPLLSIVRKKFALHT